RVVALGYLLHVGQTAHDDVRHEQPAVGDVAVDFGEDDRLACQVELQKAVLTTRGDVVWTPDRVEPLADPRAGQLRERTERPGDERRARLGGQGGRRIRSFGDWVGERAEGKVVVGSCHY